MKIENERITVKNDIIRIIADQTGISASVIRKVIESFIEVIKEMIRNDCKVRIPGFITIGSRIIPEQEAWNYKLKKYINIKPYRRMSIRISPKFKEEVRHIL